ncbi:MAG: replication factor C small subunit [Candidatus Aenigmatarchaeota archaeon]
MEIWTEKYRPQNLAEVVNQSHAVERLQAWVKSGSIPHLIFAGPAGTGKTCCAIAVARELFGKHWRENFQETNASDERGIDVVRGRIKDFARVKPLGADFKIVFLDESDSLTPEAQQALRRTIERFSDVCRFILSCNYSNKLIEPIQSRAAVFRFRRLAQEHVESYLDRIMKGEKLHADKETLSAIYEVSGGDMRKAVNLLQAAAAMGRITRETVYSVASQARPQDIKVMLQKALEGNFPDARKMLYDMLINQGLDGSDVIRAIHREIFDLDIPEERKVKLIEHTGDIEFRLNQGGTPEIQLEALLAQFIAQKGQK